MTRPSWERYFMDITHLVAKRSTCIRRQVGAILVKDKRVLATGYHGTSIKDAVLFCTNLPCSICIKMIINAGIKTVYYEDGYPDTLSEDLIKEAGLTLTNIQKSVK